MYDFILNAAIANAIAKAEARKGTTKDLATRKGPGLFTDAEREIAALTRLVHLNKN